MQSEEFDKKVKEAADHHHPAYDEKAWGKMEQLLDKHLPQEKDDRRRIIFFLLLFLLLGSGIWLIATKPWGNNKSVAQIKQDEQKRNLSPKTNSKINSPFKGDGEEGLSGSNKKKVETKTDVIIPDNNNKQPLQQGSKEKADKVVAVFEVTPKSKNTFITATGQVNQQYNKPDSKMTDSRIQQKEKAATEFQQQESIDNNVKKLVSDPVAVITTVTTINEPVAGKNVMSNDSVNADLNKPASIEVAIKADETVVEKPVVKKTQAKKKSSFFVSLSSGADISFAGLDKLGKTKLFAGAGLGYTFKNRITIRTGFYSGRKIYSALADDYHPPTSFYNYYPYLEKVDADCKVYEIPISVSYNFGKSRKQNWFVSTGLSSYLMKSESYNYFYKYTYTGPTLNKKWTIEDENKHYFSVLTLSGGYQRNLGKHFLIMAEPYVKLPLSGVGYGKVNLNSAGLLFSIGFKPFNSSKKPQK